MNRTEYKNKHRKEHYDTILFVFPKGGKDKIKAAAGKLKMSVNEYLYSLVCADLASGESRWGQKMQEFTEEQGIKYKYLACSHINSSGMGYQLTVKVAVEVMEIHMK